MLGLTNREAADRRQQGLGNEQVNSSTPDSQRNCQR